jgi:hypothetical protein
MADGYGRLWAAILDRDELRPDHRNHILHLLKVLDETTSYCHEFLATYTSFCMLASLAPDDIPAARNELPRDYAALLAAGENAFGPVGIGPAEAQVMVGMSVLQCCIAALNLPFREDAGRFSSILSTASFIRLNSPDKRFKAIVKRITPPRRRGSVLRDLQNLEFDELQPYMFRNIRSMLPRIRFNSRDERPGLMHAWLESLTGDAERHGYTFMRGAELLPNVEEESFEWFGARADLPGLRNLRLGDYSEMPLDLSFSGTRGYAMVGLAEIVAEANALCGLNERLYVLLTPDRNGGPGLFIGCPYRPDFRPVAAECTAQEMLDALTAIPSRSLVVKIDERLASPKLLKELSATGHPIFVLLHDTRPHHLIETIAALASRQRVYVFMSTIHDIRNFGILIAYAEIDRYALMLPITTVGIRSLMSMIPKATNVIYPDGTQEWLAKVPLFSANAMELRHFHELLAVTFVGQES